MLSATQYPFPILGLKDEKLLEIIKEKDRTITITVMPEFVYDHMVSSEPIILIIINNNAVYSIMKLSLYSFCNTVLTNCLFQIKHLGHSLRKNMDRTNPADM